MQSDDTFCDMINSIQFLNMSKTGTDETASMSHADSGFNSGAEMNTDNIFFYEDSCPSLSSISLKNQSDNSDLMSGDHQLPNYDNRSPAEASAIRQNRRHDEMEMTQIQVNVGIDEDLKMILEMDPSLMDMTLEKAVEPKSHVVDCPKVLGLPPKG